MTSVTSTAATTAATAATASATTTTTSTKSAALDQAAFLKLMTTQLQTQDPFNPVDNTQMVAQLAQFSSVAGIAEMNTSLKTIAAGTSGSRLGDASGWIGRETLLPATTAVARSDGSYAGQVTLPSAAASANVSLVDAKGVTVHSQNLGAQAAGAVGFGWDGKDASGNAVAGPLKVVVNAQDAAGNAITPTVATWATVTAIQSPASGTAAKLVTALGLFAPADAQVIG